MHEGPRLPKLVREPLPPGYPGCYRAYRFCLDDYIVSGLFAEVRLSKGRVIFKSYRGMKNTVRTQDPAELVDSHIVIPNTGIVDTELLPE